MFISYLVNDKHEPVPPYTIDYRPIVVLNQHNFNLDCHQKNYSVAIVMRFQCSQFEAL